MRRDSSAGGRREGSAQLWRPTPLWAFELAEIPTKLHFIRHHFPAPSLEPDAWSLTVDGSRESMVWDVDQLRSLPSRTLAAVLECAGHRRVEFDPLPSGVPWACGAVGEARWTGVSLRTVIEPAGIPADAHEIVLQGEDSGHVEGFAGTHHFARSLPVEKALDHDVLLAYEMNGEPIPTDRGGPVRAVVPGWYATDSVKWLTAIWFTREPFDGVFQAHDYRLQAPGEAGPGERMTELPVNSLITTPHDDHGALPGSELVIRGVAWGGHGGIGQVLVRLDDGPWAPAALDRSGGRHGGVRWVLTCTLEPGGHTVSAQAIDRSGNAQPDAPVPNVRGYANSAVHRVRFRTT